MALRTRPTRRAVVRAARVLLTLNFEKSLKKNETALDFSKGVRFIGSFGLSPPLPPAVEHHFPVHAGGGLLMRTRTAARGSLRAARRLAGRCARLC